MAHAGLDVPVVLIMFRRPEPTRAVLDAISAVEPRRLFVIADGPRPDRPDDLAKCQESRALLDRVTWNCGLQVDLAEHNLGCGRRISSGLDWVFEHVDRAIILEDDCVPDPSFFHFCEELLERHEADPRIRTISGHNVLSGRTRTDWSYHFSSFHRIWGWATWRRSWRRVDMGMRLWPQVRDGGWLTDMIGGDRRSARFWGDRFEATYTGRIDSWAYPYLFSCWLDHSLAVIPNRNLVRNVGFGRESTHTRDHQNSLDRAVEPMPFPLVHPPFMVCDRVSDRETFRRRCLPEESPWPRRMARHLYVTLSGAKSHSVQLGQGRLFERAEVAARG